MTTICAMTIYAAIASHGATEQKLLTFDIDKPQRIERAMLDIKASSKNAAPIIAAVDGPVAVEMVRKDHSATIEAELVLLTEPLPGSLYFDFNSKPMSRDDAIKLASNLCDLAALDKSRVTAWANAKVPSDPREPLEIRRNKGEVTVSLEVRPSFRDDLPWRILMSFGFDRTR